MEEARLGEWNGADWLGSLTAVESAEESDLVRRATRVGEPLGSEAFVKGLEAKAGRRLTVRTPGRPPVQETNVIAGQMSLFAS